VATVLVVDDEEMVTRVACAVLERVGHTVFVAGSGEEAELLAEGTDRIDVIIVDHRAPPSSGREIAEHVLRKHPKARVIHTSGYPRMVLESEGGLTPGSSFLPKPFTTAQIRSHV